MKEKPTWADRVIKQAVRMFGCDTARISSPMEKHFLVIGWNEHSRGEWQDQDGNPQYFSYIRELTVASGRTLRELTASMKAYRSLLEMDTGRQKSHDKISCHHPRRRVMVAAA